MNEIKQEILDLLILNGRKPQSIKSGERVVYLYDALNIVNKEFSKTDQPQLNGNQQIVLDWLKEYMLDDSDFYNTIYASKQLYSYGVPYGEESKAFTKLNNRELAQVLEVFSRWAQEQGEE
ncbi:hypothetical protein ABQD87_07940 [Enterococcus gallinarum]|uniref:hypothetical protein n=1 Tax=Enterococcus gallinarum TaxID=1353 RepID=UPI0032E413EE